MDRALPGVLAAALCAVLSTSASAANHAVIVGDNFYSSSRVAVKPGDTVTWTTSGNGFHNVAFDDRALIDPSPPRQGPWSTSRTFPAEGDFRYQCQVHGPQGMAGFVYVNSAANVPPVPALAVSPHVVPTGQPVTFSAAAAVDPDGTIVRYEWDLDGNGSFETDTGQTPSLSRTFATPATVQVSVRVTDDDGRTAQTARTLRVSAPPRPSFTVTPNPVSPGREVIFDASGSTDLDGSVAGYEWDLDGDGFYETDTAQTARISRAYATMGVFTVGLRVTDNVGLAAVATRSVRVGVTPVIPDAPAASADEPTFSGSKRRIRVGRNGRFRYRFRAGSRLTGTVALRSSPPRINLGRKRFTVPAAGVVTVTWKLSRRHLAALRRRRTIRFRATVKVRNGSGRVTSAGTPLTLVRPR